MIAHIIVQIVVVLIAIAGITQTIIFKKQEKANWWLGIVITILMIASSIAIWFGN